MEGDATFTKNNEDSMRNTKLLGGLSLATCAVAWMGCSSGSQQQGQLTPAQQLQAAASADEAELRNVQTNHEILSPDQYARIASNLSAPMPSLVNELEHANPQVFDSEAAIVKQCLPDIWSVVNDLNGTSQESPTQDARWACYSGCTAGTAACFGLGAIGTLSASAICIALGFTVTGPGGVAAAPWCVAGVGGAVGGTAALICKALWNSCTGYCATVSNCFAEGDVSATCSGSASTIAMPTSGSWTGSSFSNTAWSSFTSANSSSSTSESSSGGSSTPSSSTESSPSTTLPPPSTTTIGGPSTTTTIGSSSTNSGF